MSGQTDFSPAERNVADDGHHSVRRQATRLGFAGLIPFVALAVMYGMTGGEVQQETGRALVAYGAVIVSFLGAIHWGTAISNAVPGNPTQRMMFSVLPALLGWLSILLPLVYGIAVIIASLCVVYLVDRRWGCLHDWYLVLRGRLTLVASMSMAFVLISTYGSF